MEHPEHESGKRSWGTIILVIALLGAATIGFYLYFGITPAARKAPVAEVTTQPTPDADTAISTIPQDTATHDEAQAVITDPSPKETPKQAEKTKPAPVETGSLRLQSAQGFWYQYTGEVRNGKAHGKGKAVFENGNTYEGHFENDMRSGYGVATTSNGEKYEGQWANDRFNGKGTYTWKNGDHFVGYFKDAKRTGPGKLYNRKGKVLSEGNWNNDQLVK